MKKRWRYYIDRDFQNIFILRFSFVIILNVFITLAFIWMIREKSYNLLPDNAPVLVQVDPERAVQISIINDTPVLDEDNGKFYFPLKTQENKPARFFNAFDLYTFPIIATGILNVIVISIFSLFFSHKMAGPIKRIKNTLQGVSEGKEFHPIKLRKGDFFQDLAEKINQSILKKGKKSD